MYLGAVVIHAREYQVPFFAQYVLNVFVLETLRHLALLTDYVPFRTFVQYICSGPLVAIGLPWQAYYLLPEAQPAMEGIGAEPLSSMHTICKLQI